MRNLIKCKRCYLRYDVCGANSFADCASIYRNKWIVLMEKTMRILSIVFLLVVVFFLMFSFAIYAGNLY